MSAAQLILPAVSESIPISHSRLPVHASFTDETDILVMLWETGSIKLTDLRTRLGPGRGKVMDPVEIWTGLACEAKSSRVYRQIMSTSEGAHLTLFALGSDDKEGGKDVLSIIRLKNLEVEERLEIDLPRRNGRLIPSDMEPCWQAPDGEILNGTVPSFSVISVAEKMA